MRIFSEDALNLWYVGRVKMPALIYSLLKPAWQALFWDKYALSVNEGIAANWTADTKIESARIIQARLFFLEIISQRQRAIDAEELILHLGIAVPDDRDVILKLKYQLAAYIKTIQRRLAAV